MRKLVESNLIEKTKTYEEQAYRRWILQRDDSAIQWGNATRIGYYTLKPKQKKPYCHTETTLKWTSGSKFELELELPKISENLSQFRIVYHIQTGNKITSFRIKNPENTLVYYWDMLAPQKILTYGEPNNPGLSNYVEFHLVIDYMQGMYTVYLTDEPDV